MTKAMKDLVSGETSKKQGIKLLHLKKEEFDAIICENLNSLMDDNRRYAVANGFQCKLPNDVRIVFESKGARLQSPATVSRTGFVFFTFE
mgnify:CR=1 FL=1